MLICQRRITRQKKKNNMYLQLNENNFEYKILSQQFGANHKFLVVDETTFTYHLKEFSNGFVKENIVCNKERLKLGSSIFKLVKDAQFAQLELEF